MRDMERTSHVGEQLHEPQPRDVVALEQTLRRHLRGEVRFDAGSRAAAGRASPASAATSRWSWTSRRACTRFWRSIRTSASPACSRA